ncbi:30S ribosome-binding factor RbfA [Egibacter rhizosphaerae]|uniref:Ribosome-binding factor A n=2 Tax=Egibacter rhizosphaerae TaxID=1670831 RepID=A0A411YL18_9ACTN|nr:30S ribosome-binding factor RbfA [Egibacter rhizosphaerae]
MRRVDEQLREVLAEAVRGLKDPRIGFVTITGVRTSPDLGQAEVYYTVLEDDEAVRAATAEGLAHAAAALRRQLARSVRLKRVPDLHFVADPATEHGQRIEALLREVADQQPSAAEEDEG